MFFKKDYHIFISKIKNHYTMSKNSAKARYEQFEEWRKSAFPEKKETKKKSRFDTYKDRNVK